jgi:hypothetical protein
MAGMLALAYPLAEAVYTQMFGDRATARVTQCREHKGNPTRFGVGTTTSCSGTWVTSGGQRGSGRIENAGHGDIGRAMEIRIGPHGAEAGNPLADPVVVVIGGIWASLLVTVVATVLWALRAGRRAARRPAADAAPDAVGPRTTTGHHDGT